MPTLHQTFTPVTIHTAKCDICNQHNRSVLFRCADCGWHVCTPCWTEKGGDGTHFMNEGDRGYRGGVVGRGRGRGAGDARRGRDGRDRGEARDEECEVRALGDVTGGTGGRVEWRERGRRRQAGDTSRDPAQDPISVAAAADLLIQAASRASPSPSLSPPPALQRPSASASTRPSASVRANDTARASTRASRPSTSTSASASRREKANISRLLRAAETIDRSSTPPSPLPPLPLRGNAGVGRRDKRRATSPLFVEYGLVEVEEEVVADYDDYDDHNDHDDDEMTGLEMTPEPRSPDEDIGEEMRDASPGPGFEMSDDERGVVGGPSRVPSGLPSGVTGGRDMLVPKGKEGREDGGVRRRTGRDEAGAKVPVARRLRELYRSAVLVKDQKGRMRRVGGGLVGRREGRGGEL